MARRLKYKDVTVSKQPSKEASEDDEVKLLEKHPDKAETLVAGYELGELAKAPLDPPTPVKTEAEGAAANDKVRALLMIGLIIALLGVVIIFATFSLKLGLFIMAIGAITITAGVFLPVR